MMSLYFLKMEQVRYMPKLENKILDKEAMIQALDDCLVTEDDMLKGEEFWTSLEDPFPPWQEIQ